MLVFFKRQLASFPQGFVGKDEGQAEGVHGGPHRQSYCSGIAERAQIEPREQLCTLHVTSSCNSLKSSSVMDEDQQLRKTQLPLFNETLLILLYINHFVENTFLIFSVETAWTVAYIWRGFQPLLGHHLPARCFGLPHPLLSHSHSPNCY